MTELRDAIRTLRAAPIVSAVAVLSLALGIGANTAIFSIVNSLILRTLPVQDPERLVLVQAADEQPRSWTYPIWEQIRDRPDLFDGAIAWSYRRFNTARSGETRFVEGLFANGRYFDVLGVPAILGRTFTEADDRRGGGPDGPVTVISYGFWQSRFGGAADAIGKTIVLQRVPYTIVGVTPPEFFGTEVGRTFDVVVPFGTEPLLTPRSGLEMRSFWWLQIMLRLKPGQSLDAATTTLRGVQPQIRTATMPPDWRPQDLKRYLAVPFALRAGAAGTSSARLRFERPIVTLMVVVGLVLLIACANIANLMLARATARRHEMSVRLALGASRRRLARQLFTESLILSTIGAVSGLLFARWAGPLLVAQLSTTTNRIFLDLDLDWRILAFTAGTTVATAVLFGTAPAFRATRVQPSEVLKEQGRPLSGDRFSTFGNALVVAQMALSLVLLVAAGLFVNTFARLGTLKLGFDGDPVLVTSFNAQRSAVSLEDRAALFERLREAAASTPGVESAALSVVTPVSGASWGFGITVPGGPALPDNQRSVHVNLVSPGYFQTYRTRLLAGRDFGSGDTLGAPPVAIVNETFARTFMNGETPIARTLTEDASPGHPAVTREIVGYVEDAVYGRLREPVPPTLYIPYMQRKDEGMLSSGMSISVRAAAGSPALLTRSIAAALSRVDPDVALTFRPLAEQINSSLVQERVVAMLSAFFGGLALLLAGLGLYGVTSYAVGRRRPEIGIRVALGAAPGDVVAMVLWRVGVLVLAGVAAGAAASLWTMKFVGPLLFGVEPRDPATLVVAATVLGTIGAAAGWLPARRASRIDPAQVLREM